MKLKVQAQSLQPGDVVGSGDTVCRIIIDSIKWPSNKVYIELLDDAGLRSVLWGKYTMINVERPSTRELTVENVVEDIMAGKVVSWEF